MTSAICEMVKRGGSEDDFGSFLRHVTDCGDCQRRIASRIVVEFNQRKNGDE